MEATAAVPTTQLNPGEIDLGIVIEDGRLESARRVILLPGDNDDAPRKDAQAWAASIGGELPTRMELLLAFKTQRDQFKRDAYWSCEPCAGHDADAWGQHFYYGIQDFWHKDGAMRARAVRREVI